MADLSKMTDNLVSLLQDRGISQEGCKAVLENGVDSSMLCEFTEEDIKDLFVLFRDRFLIRKLLNQVRSCPTPYPCSTQKLSQDLKLNSSENQTNSSILKHEHDEPSRNKPESTKETVNITYGQHYSCDDMLAPKPVRGKPTEAQHYFHNIIREAASTAGIWKNASVLRDIAEHQKHAFFSCLEHVSPQLLTRKKDVWSRLGKHLQNRRKYLLDSQLGKRNLKNNRKLSSVVQEGHTIHEK